MQISGKLFLFIVGAIVLALIVGTLANVSILKGIDKAKAKKAAAASGNTVGAQQNAEPQADVQ